MLTDKEKAELKHSFIFKDLDESVFENEIEGIYFDKVVYEKNDTVCSPERFKNSIGIVVVGKCEIWRFRDSTENILLNTVLPGGSFGVLAVLSDKKQFPTYVIASKKTTVIYIDADDLLCLIKRNGQIAMNVISFLANRIDFLNDKVSTFSASSVEQKLAKFLILSYLEAGSTEIRIPKSQLAHIIGVGRASLYRAIEGLTSLGAVDCSANKFVIKNMDMLERISQ